MANSKYTYVRDFEEDTTLLNECWTVIRVDGRSFGVFSDKHNFRKPNEPKALALINTAAVYLMSKFDDIILAYGHSDEYSFLLKRSTRLYNRRKQKILSSIVSTFSSAYCHFWNLFFPDQPLLSVPSFDGRIVLYPTYQTVVDYFSWRHVDCHINNQYNTCFWCLVLDGKSNTEAYDWLKGTTKVEKNEYIFSSRGLNYNNLPNIFKKGTTLIKCNNSTPEIESNLNDLKANDVECVPDANMVDSSRRISLTVDSSEIENLETIVKNTALKHNILVLHCDVVKDSFWKFAGPIVFALTGPLSCRNAMFRSISTAVISEAHISSSKEPDGSKFTNGTKSTLEGTILDVNTYTGPSAKSSTQRRGQIRKRRSNSAPNRPFEDAVVTTKVDEITKNYSGRQVWNDT
nr:hypothetical protein MACL_00000910 [Theileria orientalis]